MQYQRIPTIVNQCSKEAVPSYRTGGVHGGPGEHVLEHELAAVGHPHQAPAGRLRELRDAGGARRARRARARAARRPRRQPHARHAATGRYYTTTPQYTARL